MIRDSETDYYYDDDDDTDFKEYYDFWISQEASD
jgi:hypothetical protein